MTTPAKAKGDRAEREAVELLRSLGLHVRRRYGAGMPNDEADVLIGTVAVAQIRNLADYGRACHESALDAERQAATAGVAYGVGMARRRGGRFVVTMTPETFAAIAHAIDPRTREEHDA